MFIPAIDFCRLLPTSALMPVLMPVPIVSGLLSPRDELMVHSPPSMSASGMGMDLHQYFWNCAFSTPL